NSTASSLVEVTRAVICGEPVMRRSRSRGSDWKRACWPGKSSETPTPSEDSWERPPPAPERPGRADTAGGLAPAGLSKRCWNPVRRTVSGPLLRPGYRSALAPRSVARPSVESTPPVRLTRKAGPVSAFRSPLRWRSNQARTRRWTRSVSGSPPSWPPAIQSTSTGAPLARMARAAASAWERGNVDAVGDGGRRAFPQQGAGLGVRHTGLGDPLVHRAQRGLEPVAAATGVDEDAGPQLLEHAAREQRVGEVEVGDGRGDRVD